MLIFSAVKNTQIRRVWLGQALSTIGDEIYRVGLTWMMVGLLGTDAGYINSLQAAALMALSLVGGKWSDHWNPRKTMICVDVIRGVLVLIPVVLSFYWHTSAVILVSVAVCVAGLSAFFDPALQEILPVLAHDTATMKAATGLMQTTIRMARMLGPTLIGFLAGILPVIHFFTIDALSFFASAYFVKLVSFTNQEKRTLEESTSQNAKVSFLEALTSGFKVVRRIPGMSFIFFSKSIVGGTWSISYSLGLALLVQSLTPGDARSYGWVMASYGTGNFLGSLYFGNQNRVRPALMMFLGYIALGLGFIWVAHSHSIGMLMAATSFAGFTGPGSEIPFIDMVQTHFPKGDLKRMIRLRMATETGATLLLTLASPFLFRLLGVPLVIQLTGSLWVLFGFYGMAKYQKALDSI